MDWYWYAAIYTLGLIGFSGYGLYKDAKTAFLRRGEFDLEKDTDEFVAYTLLGFAWPVVLTVIGPFKLIVRLAHKNTKRERAVEKLSQPDNGYDPTVPNNSYDPSVTGYGRSQTSTDYKKWAGAPR